VDVDVAVIGAGAAGLAAARSLRELGADVLVVEGQNRVGGRAYTMHSRSGNFPVELGAEFIHGKAPATMQLLHEAGTGTLEIGESPPGVWEATERVLRRVDVNAADCSVDEFLKRIASPDAAQARMLIQGFDAAITSDASIVAIANEWLGPANDTHARPAAGYGALMEHLAHGLRERILLNTPVKRIGWSPAGVNIDAVRDGNPVQIHARAAIVTLPISLLRENAVQFDPPLPEEKQRAIDAIGMGPVVKVVLEFRSVFWDQTFWQTPHACGFRTVWSRMPQRAPLLVAWAGGDAAQELMATDRDPVEEAIGTCEQLFADTDVRSELISPYRHDWENDPFARGAYSYLRVNGKDARERLALPVGAVLYFAGEATCAHDAGTVAGALQSGYRAAQEVGENNQRR
jgi:monoamine oxidase